MESFQVSQLSLEPRAALILCLRVRPYPSTISRQDKDLSSPSWILKRGRLSQSLHPTHSLRFQLPEIKLGLLGIMNLNLRAIEWTLTETTESEYAKGYYKNQDLSFGTGTGNK
jgi:hypothetical protein